MVMPTAPTTYPPGTVIADRYRIETVLGIGGFGAVYKCIQLNMNQAVAVKVLKMEHITSEEHVRRFEREARAASKLRHPNTISIFDFGTHEDGALYLAMEYLEGEALADRLDGGPMPAPELVHIMSQVCHSLTEAHNSGLVHRDLKPENIMLMSVAGDPNFVKVLDFGIAKVDDEHSAHEERLTEMGMIMGTPQYMSPEQAYGYKLDPRSDIYALGVLMYEALTGRVPFEGDKPMEILLKHINDPPARPTLVDAQLKLPLALERALLQCLEKQQDDRPQTTKELADLLGKALHTPDGKLRKLDEEPAAAATPEQDAVTSHVEGLAGATTVTPAGALGQQRASARDLPAQPAPSAGGSSALWLGLAAFAVVAIVAAAIALVAMPDRKKEGELDPRPAMRAGPGSPAAIPAATKPAGARTDPAPEPAKPEIKPKTAAAKAPSKEPTKAPATADDKGVKPASGGDPGTPTKDPPTAKKAIKKAAGDGGRKAGTRATNKKTEAGKAEAGKAEAGKAEAGKADAKKADAKKRDGKKVDAKKPDAKKPTTVKDDKSGGGRDDFILDPE